MSFEPWKGAINRPGSILKERWRRLRTQYTIARRNFEKSGQGEHDAFPDFTDGNDSLSYMHCVFFNQPALEMIVRVLPSTAQMECGIKGVRSAAVGREDRVTGMVDNEEWDLETPQRKKRKVKDTIEQGIKTMASAMERPVTISIKDDTADGKYNKRFETFDVSDRVAGTLEKLMRVEDSLMKRIKSQKGSGSLSDNDEADHLSDLLKSRLQKVRNRINPTLDEDDSSI